MSSSPMRVEETVERGEGVLAHNLTASYGRSGRDGPALRGFTARFAPGITGLIGPNGAGKTTFLRVASGLLRPVSGSLTLHGSGPEPFRAGGRLGFLPESPPLPAHLTVGDFLDGLSPKSNAGEPGSKPRTPPREGALSRRIDMLRSKRMASLSLGQRKAVALSAALLGEPRVLLLDEPTNGLDPRAVRELRETLLAERTRGATLIVSSHHLDELQRIADTLVFVQAGAVVGVWERQEALDAFGTLESLFDHVFQEC